MQRHLPICSNMKSWRVFERLLATLLLAGVAVFSGCNNKPAPAAPPTVVMDIDPVRGHLLHAQPKLPTIRVWLGDQELKAEICRRPVEIATGMMFRTNAPEDQAMIFVFTNAEGRNFYMRNCFVPLSGAYITPEGVIDEIIQMQPHDETGIQSKSSNIQFVLETPQGWFDRHHVRTGMVVRTESGSLMETFFPKR